ncbi:MAG: anthranilate phosphoribosyltransferase [Gammaproteobacteria bacterium]|nr:anthranilate phosphoribosyltransferase [Gammaproteobacteria bacterium]
MNIQDAIALLVDGNDLETSAIENVMTEIMTGHAEEATIGGFLVALKAKGETVKEITGAANVMRRLVEPVKVEKPNLIDICGTGGSGSNKFNVSTGSAFVAAASGAWVAKHGNRSASSNSGSADVLEMAGANIVLTPDQVARCIESVGVGFMFAVNHHSAMKHAIGPRKKLKLRTIFNLLGPLTNPARVTRQLLGVYDNNLVRPIAEVLSRLGSEHVMVVHSEDGLDEISISAKTRVAELKDGSITEYWLCPDDFSIEMQSIESLKVINSQESLSLIKRGLKGESEASRDILSLNSGAAIYLSGIADSLEAGVKIAKDAISSGAALAKMEEFCDFTNYQA